jgi:hypothetical protein
MDTADKTLFFLILCQCLFVIVLIIWNRFQGLTESSESQKIKEKNKVLVLKIQQAELEKKLKELS